MGDSTVCQGMQITFSTKRIISRPPIEQWVRPNSSTIVMLCIKENGQNVLGNTILKKKNGARARFFPLELSSIRPKKKFICFWSWHLFKNDAAARFFFFFT